MNLIYEKLFETYGEKVLKRAESYDDPAIQTFLESLPLDAKSRLSLEDAFFDHYLQWTADGFALGLHLGLSLCHDEVRRVRPQQGQQVPGR